MFTRVKTMQRRNRIDCVISDNHVLVHALLCGKRRVMGVPLSDNIMLCENGLDDR